MPASATRAAPTIQHPADDPMRAPTRAAPGMLAAILAAVLLAILSVTAADRDAHATHPSRATDGAAAPGEAAAEDWHGNVRRSHWQR